VNGRVTEQRLGETAVADVPADGWVAVRQAGKLLFEYHPERELVRVVQRKRPFVVDLRGYRPCEIVQAVKN